MGELGHWIALLRIVVFVNKLSCHLALVVNTKRVGWVLLRVLLG